MSMDDRRDWTTYVWLIYLTFFLAVPAMKRAGAAEWLVTLAVAAVFVALYLYGYSVRGRRIVWVIIAITLLGVACLPFNPGAGAFFIYAAAFAGRIDRPRWPVVAIAAIELVAIAELWLVHASIYNSLWPIVFTGLVGSVNLHYEGMHRANRRLRLAQDEIERLAKVAERERIARDLHDLLGHTLSLIILKSELASKLVDRDVSRARDEIRDVERISREALAEVRQAVGGYRTRGLANEVEAAKEMLRAASVECTADVQPVAMPASHEAILSLALREAVTNVVRHAHARHCAIRFAAGDAEMRLTIADDGRGSPAGEEGFGLRGMRERIAAFGGTLAREMANGTKLTVTLPLPAMEHSA
jgi:two-component system, NarL family, sensor histidine kinase DesK